MTTAFDTVQRIVLHGTTWEAARHVVLSFPDKASAPHFLQRLKEEGYWPTPAKVLTVPKDRTVRQVSLGFSRRGLENARVPDHVLTLLALKSPAFYAGAALRATSFLGGSGGTPGEWKKPYRFTTLDAVLSLHSNDAQALAEDVRRIDRIACECGVGTRDLAPGVRLPKPASEPELEPEDTKAMWTHFGFRDGLSRIGIQGWTPDAHMAQCNEGSRHAAGEFILGHAQNSGANPWLAGPDARVWPEEVRSFFRNGSFGVFHQIQQHVKAFDDFITAWVDKTGLKADLIKAKLCGRFTSGKLLVAPEGAIDADFDYTKDAHGEQCPFGSHIRRMNPRGHDLAHSVRRRPLLRRGLPYGLPQDQEHGLMGQFFCASIEDQFEHLVGQWADRVPLGSSDIGGARDPMFGAHASEDGVFVIPQAKPNAAIELKGMGAFATTVGLAYLFYPSLTTLDGIRNTSLWRPQSEEEEDEETG